jgi:hypothetical protein
LKEHPPVVNEKTDADTVDADDDNDNEEEPDDEGKGSDEYIISTHNKQNINRF